MSPLIFIQPFKAASRLLLFGSVIGAAARPFFKLATESSSILCDREGIGFFLRLPVPLVFMESVMFSHEQSTLNYLQPWTVKPARAAGERTGVSESFEPTAVVRDHDIAKRMRDLNINTDRIGWAQ